MANAHPTVREAAGHVAPGNDDDGVARVLEALLDSTAPGLSTLGGMALLNDEEIAAALARLPHWTRVGAGALTRSVDAPGFLDGIRLVEAVAPARGGGRSPPGHRHPVAHGHVHAEHPFRGRDHRPGHRSRRPDRRRGRPQVRRAVFDPSARSGPPAGLRDDPAHARGVPGVQLCAADRRGAGCCRRHRGLRRPVLDRGVRGRPAPTASTWTRCTRVRRPTREKLRSPAHEATCGLGDLATNRRYLFFIEGRHPGLMKVTLCGGSRAYDASTAQAVQRITGPARPPLAPPPTSRPPRGRADGPGWPARGPRCCSVRPALAASPPGRCSTPGLATASGRRAQRYMPPESCCARLLALLLCPAALPGHRAGRQGAAHLLQLRARGHLLGVDGGLDAVEEPLEPADQLRLGDPQLRLAGGVLVEGLDQPVQLLVELGGQALLELRDRGAAGSPASRVRPASSTGAAFTSSSSCRIMPPIRITLAGSSTSSVTLVALLVLWLAAATAAGAHCCAVRSTITTRVTGLLRAAGWTCARHRCPPVSADPEVRVAHRPPTVRR